MLSLDRELSLNGADPVASLVRANDSSNSQSDCMGAPPLQPTLSMQESISRRQVEYVGIRKLTRQLRNGVTVQPWLDAAVDACGHMVNLRTVVGVYRAHGVQHYMHHTEHQRMRHAFSRDIVALCRYCLLLAYAAYLDRQNAADERASPLFSEWIASMASVQVRICKCTLTKLLY